MKIILFLLLLQALNIHSLSFDYDLILPSVEEGFSLFLYQGYATVPQADTTDLTTGISSYITKVKFLWARKNLRLSAEGGWIMPFVSADYRDEIELGLPDSNLSFSEKEEYLTTLLRAELGESFVEWDPLGDDAPNFSLFLPLFPWVNVGLHNKKTALLNMNTDISGTYTLKPSLTKKEEGGSISLTTPRGELGMFWLISEISSPHYPGKGNISLEADLSSDYSYRIFLKTQAGDFKLRGSYSDSLYSINRMYGWNDQYVFMNVFSEKLRLQSGSLSMAQDESFRLALSLTKLSLDPLEIWVGSDSFVFGGILWRKYQTESDSSELFLFHISSEAFMKSGSYDFSLLADYKRIFSAPLIFQYSYQEGIMNFFGLPNVLFISPLHRECFDDKVNIVALKMKVSRRWKFFTLSAFVSLTQPFTDGVVMSVFE